MRRRGQFYMIDAFFASIILFAGMGALIAGYIAVPEQRQPQALAEDISTVLTQTPLGEIGNQYTIDNSESIDEFLTPIEQAHIWAHIGLETPARFLIEDIVTPLDDPQYSLRIVIETNDGDVTLYESVSPLDEDDAEFKIVERNVVVTEFEHLLLGPDFVEVSVWG